MFENIPLELQTLNQWVNWKLVDTDTEKQTKLPYNPRVNQLASTTNPQSWVSFPEAVGAARSNLGYSGIGFCFSAFDPYCGIDLDATKDPELFARQKAIFQAMNSYSEKSPSGQGLHIIVKAQIPHGRKRAAIELYDKDRYFTFTGDVYHSAPIEERQELVTTLWHEMGPQATPNHYAGDVFAKSSDDEVIQAMNRALNGDLFRMLWNGQWQHAYSSQSEADQALMNIIVFHTKNRFQAMQLFRQSALGQRDKAKRDKYLSYTIDKAFDMTLPPIDVSVFIDQFNAAKASATNAGHVQEQAPATVITSPYGDPSQSNPAHGAADHQYEGFRTDLWRTVPPPFLMNQIRQFIFDQSPRPVFEISMAATLGLMAGICGRAFNVDGAGLNQYIMLLAPTGRGKEAMSTGISRLMSSVAAKDFPSAWDFIGPADMASGAGLLKFLAERETPCFVSLTGEIGLRLQQMSMKGANTADLTLRKVLLDLYNKSGANNAVRPTVYSDKKNNVEIIYSPAFTWLGESTPVEFYRGLNEDQIASGLLPRFMVIEYNGERVPYNERHANVHPSHQLTQSLYDLCHMVMTLLREGKVVNIPFTAEARERTNLINAYCDHKMNTLPDGPLVQLWNRTHFKMQKVAALLAVAHNPASPVIDVQMIDWAMSLVITDVLTLTARFEAGDVGEADVKVKDSEQISLMRSAVRKFLTRQMKLTPSQIAHCEKGIIPYGVLTQQVHQHKIFRTDPRGANRAVQVTLDEMEKLGIVTRLSAAQLQEHGINRGNYYQPVPPYDWVFEPDT